MCRGNKQAIKAKLARYGYGANGSSPLITADASRKHTRHAAGHSYKSIDECSGRSVRVLINQSIKK